jgi:hypothetical protein
MKPALTLVLLVPVAFAARFYDDDPLWHEPPPMPVKQAFARKLNDQFDFFLNTFGRPGQHRDESGGIRARAVNTLGEPMNGSWYTHRHYSKRLNIAELTRGPVQFGPPATGGPWTVTSAKAEGITPGFTMQDAKGRRYFIKFDPPDYPELATAADVISARFFHALGYHVPENHLVAFTPEQLRLAPDVRFVGKDGRARAMTRRDLDEILLRAPRMRGGKIRALASSQIAGRPLGQFRYHGLRKDDPNDIVPHEDRRDLRGLSIFCAWLDHDDSRAINTLDVLVEEKGIPYVRHYLIDFGSTLGSASTGPNSPRSGGEYLFAWEQVVKRTFALGLVVPWWARAKYPGMPSVGRFESDVFDPLRWVPEYPNPAFENRLPDDEFWAAKQVMAFTDEEIRAVVKMGEYSDPAAEQYVVETLIARRDKIGRAFLNRVLPLDKFQVRDSRLVFEDLAARHGIGSAGQPGVTWSRFDNHSETKTRIDAAGFHLPSEILRAEPGSVFAADIAAEDTGKSITVFLRKTHSDIDVIGIDRRW